MPRPATLLIGAFWIYPLLWALGVQSFVWVMVAAAMMPALVESRRRLLVPRGFGLWLLFLGWVVISAFTVTEIDRAGAAVYRAACYLAATVILVTLVNAATSDVSSRQLVFALGALWAWSVALAFVALAAPDVDFRTPTEVLLPESVRSIPFVESLVHPRLAGHDYVVDVVRPRALYQYTNSWGSAIGLLTPVVVHMLATLESRWIRWVLAGGLVLSLVPIVMSINRGLWLSLGVAVAWVLMRRFFRGEGRLLAQTAAATVAAGLVVWFSPLRGIIEARLDNPNLTTRETLYAAAIRVAGESPLIGHGAPVSGSGLYDSNDASIGTHGQFWTVLVSQGWPGALLFAAFMVAMIVLTWNIPSRALWLHAVLVVAFVQIFFYDLLPVGIIIYVIAISLCIRACRQDDDVGRSTQVVAARIGAL